MSDDRCEGFDGVSFRCTYRIAANRLADEVAALVTGGALDSRSGAGDALLDYRDPPRTARSDRIAELERRLAALERVVELAREMRRYCLGTDASTENMIRRFDAALAAVPPKREGGE